MVHGVHILLHTPWPMGNLCYLNCCTTCGPWVIYTSAQPMIHGNIYNCTAHGSWVCIPLYNLWLMGGVCYLNQCTTHGPWGICYCTTHDTWVYIPLYSPWSMENMCHLKCCTTHSTWGIYHCTTHGPWGMCTVSIGVQPMVHGVYIVAQPMVHGVYIPLHNPWPMESMCHLKCCTTHGT